MKADLSIDEIREVRRRISEEHGHDTRALLDHYRALEKLYPDRLLRGRPDSYSPESEAQGGGAE